MSAIVNSVVNVVSAVGTFYGEINPATLSGAIDIIVVRQPNGELHGSPFHVRFGKLKLLRPSDKVVEIAVNGKTIDLPMKVGDAGEAFFVVKADNPVPSEYATSPIVTAVSPNVDESFTNFELNADDTKFIDEIDISKLGIGEKKDSPSLSPTTPTIHNTKKPVDIPVHTEIELDLAQRYPNSPPWEWSWGGLPEKQDSHPKTLSKMTSTPQFKNTKIAYGPATLVNEEMSVNEKVDNYLTSIEFSSETRVAMNQELNENKCQDILGLGESEESTVYVSQCGPITNLSKLSKEEADTLFNNNLVEFDIFCERPDRLLDPSTVFKIHGFYHSWSSAAPVIMSHVLFNRSLSTDGLRKVLKPEPNRSSSWFSWGRSTPKPISSPNLIAAKLDRAPSPLQETSPRMTSRSASPSLEKVRYAKSLRLTSDQLNSLGLEDGPNTIQFTVNSGFQGKAVTQAKIYLWNYDDQIVISDVDGTITKSDVLGHVFTMVGKDWTHEGVANFYTSIAKNGYHFLYLTSRAIGQAGYTREYLAKVEQNQFQLPEGPILLSPDRLVQAFTREVIQRKPQEFKIQCLRDIKKLFGDRLPFFAGFGNRITDAMSYKSVDIPASKIFTIDPTGQVKLELMTNYNTTYTKLNETVDQLFPPMKVMLPEYNDFNYWKNDYPAVKIDVEEDSDDSEDEDLDLNQKMSQMQKTKF
ncbi:Nuclear elongation and deformation protein 1 [Terramyces sp. JEL0728]|nr:Nuclear elongation and deformation protein 1 [Terramyces sp. JEL0728]